MASYRIYHHFSYNIQMCLYQINSASCFIQIHFVWQEGEGKKMQHKENLMIFTVNPQYRGLKAKFEGCISTSHYPFTINVNENDHTSLSRAIICGCIFIFCCNKPQSLGSYHKQSGFLLVPKDPVVVFHLHQVQESNCGSSMSYLK